MGIPWVCLMYHDITAEVVRARGGPERFAVPRSEFARQLDQLRREGFTPCSISQALAGDAERMVAVSFDDGDAGQYAAGFHELKSRGMTATFFVTTDWVGRPGYVTWDQLREMRTAGMDVQSHSRSHPFLSELGRQDLERELRDSRAALDQQLGQTTTMLALPGGDWPRRRLRGAIAQAGYSVVATSRWGVNNRAARTGLTILSRCTISGVTDPDRFTRIAAGDDDLARGRVLREKALNALRSALGASRSQRWRRRFLDAVTSLAPSRS